MFTCIFACDEDFGIGSSHTLGLPWANTMISKADLNFFYRTTQNSSIIMGHNTWMSLPKKPLKHRRNIVVTRDTELGADVICCVDFETALKQAQGLKIFVIGGLSVFEVALQHPQCQEVLFTNIPGRFKCDLLIPPKWFDGYVLSHMQDLTFGTFQFANAVHCLVRRNIEEEAVLGLFKDVLEHGELRDNRTPIRTLGVFGRFLRFSLRANALPLLTTKQVHLRGIFEELKWFIRGDTNANHLKDVGVNIWNGNTTREFLDQRGLQHYKVGDIGALYGHQWRHFGAEYKGMSEDYRGQGYDQLNELIHTIRTDPNSRRLLLTSYNPADVSKAVLAPCHVLAQFYVSKGRLSCMMTQRSCDLGLGFAYNLASYSLFTIMLAHVTRLTPGEFVYSIGDAHIYETHIQGLQEQITRKPKQWPQLFITRTVENIEDFAWQDFELRNYDPAPRIKMDMVA